MVSYFGEVTEMSDFGANPIINKVLESFIKRTEVALKQAAEREGLHASGEMIDSIRKLIFGRLRASSIANSNAWK